MIARKRPRFHNSCAAGAAVAQDKTANVAGAWTIDVTRGGANAKQSITLTQDGGKITGTKYNDLSGNGFSAYYNTPDPVLPGTGPGSTPVTDRVT